MKSSNSSPLRFVLIALCRLYFGINNIKKAFGLSPFREWVAINWLLFVVGVILILIVIPCVYFAQSELNEKKQAEAEKELENQKLQKNRYMYDNEEFPDSKETET